MHVNTPFHGRVNIQPFNGLCVHWPVPRVTLAATHATTTEAAVPPMIHLPHHLPHTSNSWAPLHLPHSPCDPAATVANHNATMPPCHHGPLQHPLSPGHCPSAVVPPHPPPHRHCGSPCSCLLADGTLAWPTACPTFYAGAARSCVGWPTWLSILNFLNNSHLFVTKISVINFNHRPMPPFFVVIIIVLSLKLDDNSKANCYRNLLLKYFGDKCYLITKLDVKAFVTGNFGDKFGNKYSFVT